MPKPWPLLPALLQQLPPQLHSGIGATLTLLLTSANGERAARKDFLPNSMFYSSCVLQDEHCEVSASA